MLQYLAVLSGGQYLGQQVAKKLKRADKGHKAGDGVAMYSFQGLKAVQHPKYVQTYMDNYDKLEVGEQREALLDCCKRVYVGMLKMMDECHAMAPAGDPNAVKEEKKEKPVSTEDMKLTMQELSEYDGIKQKRLIMSISRVLLDVSSAGNMYGPGGGYHLFAGNDCTRNLATMNLDRKALGDPDFAPTTDSHKKVLQDWVDKLSGKYPVVGELVGPGTFTGDEDGVKSSAAAHAAKEGSDAACPITGQTAKDGASCPMSTSTSAGECPWPFVFFHDPMSGLQSKHAWKNLVVVAAVLAVLYPMLT